MKNVNVITVKYKIAGKTVLKKLLWNIRMSLESSQGFVIYSNAR